MTDTTGIVLDGPRTLSLADIVLTDPAEGDAVVGIRASGVSTGTEKLFWEGRKPPFPGMGYPLVPGYESVGEVVEARPGSGLAPPTPSLCPAPIATARSAACSAARPGES